MKKIFTLALSAMLLGASSVFAQEEDVTSYIANPGFDEDLTFQADGSYKEIVDKSGRKVRKQDKVQKLFHGTLRDARKLSRQMSRIVRQRRHSQTRQPSSRKKATHRYPRSPLPPRQSQLPPRQKPKASQKSAPCGKRTCASVRCATPTS